MRRFATLDLVDWLMLLLIVGALLAMRAVVLDLDGELDAVERLQALELQRAAALTARTQALTERAWDDELELHEERERLSARVDRAESSLARLQEAQQLIKVTCDDRICPMPAGLRLNPITMTIECDGSSGTVSVGNDPRLSVRR